MSDYPISQCRSCHKRIIWTTNLDSGKRMPVDADAAEHGNVILLSGNDGPEARVLTKIELSKRPTKRDLYVSHFSTCPQARDWRQR